MVVLTLLAALAAAVVLVVALGREASTIPQAALNNESGEIVRADSQTPLQLSSTGTAGDLGARS